MNMKQNNFEEKIRKLKALKIPDCPTRLETNVLRRVRKTQTSNEASVWDFMELISPVKGFALAVLTVVVMTSFFVTASQQSAQTQSSKRQIEINHLFGFDAITAVIEVDLSHH